MAIDAWGRWDGQIDSGVPSLQGSLNTTNPEGYNTQTSGIRLQAPNTGTGDQRIGVSAPAPAPAPVRPPAPVETPEQRAIRMAADAAERERQARIQKANQLRSGISNMIGTIRGVYDAIYGDIDVAANDQISALTERNAMENKTLTNQFATEFPKIGNAYGARGVYDSSYRMDAENAAQTGFNDELARVGMGFKEDLGKVGKYVAGARAEVGAGRTTLDNILRQIAETDDPDQLMTLRAKLEEKQNQLNVSRAGMLNQSGYLGQLNEIAPANDRISSLTTSLGNVMNSAIPASLKRSIGTQLINNAALPPAQAQQILDQFSGQLGTAASDDKERTT